MAVTPILLHELLRRCLRSGGPADWEELLTRVQPLMAKTAWRIAATSGSVKREDIDDIVQETCMKLGVSRAETIAHAVLESEAAASSYIKVMTLNTARDHFDWLRRRPVRSECELAGPLDEFAAAQAPIAERSLLFSQIDSCLDADDRGRSVFWLYYRHGYTAKEVSQIPRVGLSVKGVESLLSRLAEGVRRCMGGEKFKGKSAGGTS